MDDENALPEMSAEEQQLEMQINAEPAPAVPEKPAEQEQPKTVPIQALDEARHQLRELKEQDRVKGEKIAVMNARFEDALRRFAAQNQPTPQVPQIPDWEKDPLGHTKVRHDLTEKDITDLKAWKQNQEMGAVRAAQGMQFRAQAQTAAVEFAQKTPDYVNAYAHLMQQQAGLLKLAGFDAPAIQQTLQQYEAAIAARAFQSGGNPAERLYEMAKAAGYKNTPAAAQQMQTLKKGADAAKSLSGAGGDVEPPMTLEALAEMDGPDFDKMFDKIVQGGRKNGGLGGFFGS